MGVLVVKKVMERSHQHFSHLCQQGDFFDQQANAGLCLGILCKAGMLTSIW